MNSSLADVVDRVDRESYESYLRLALKLHQSINSCAVNGIAGRAVDMDIPEGLTARQKAASAERIFGRMMSFVDDDFSAAFKITRELNAKFTDTANGMGMALATPRAIASMTEGQCKEALLIACKVASEMTQIAGLRNAQYAVMGERLNTQSSHEKLFFEEALKATQALNQLRRELGEKAKECVDLANGVKTAADRLNMLGSDGTTKSIAARRKESDLPLQLDAAIAITKQMFDSERTKTKRLQDQVKYFKKQLDAYRASERLDANDLQAQLDTAIAEGSATKKRADELTEKLRCQICMDRPRDTAFACGHTCCKQCSVEWKKCTFNCVSERRQKPVKFTFPLYFN